MVPEPLRGHGAAVRLYPISKNITTADSHAGTFTAACGVLVYRSGGLPDKYLGGVFSCDPTANLVHFDTLEPAGATFVSRRSAEQSEFLESSDDWFRPVNLAQGPDGALYVCDMYRKTIEHPDYLPPEIRKHTDFESGKGMGRIYRVVSADVDAAALKERRASLLAGKSTTELCSALGNADAWWCDTAFRLLYEGHDKAAVPPLQALAGAGQSPPVAVVRALRLLDAFGALDAKLLSASLSHESPGVREHAIQLAEPRFSKSPEFVGQVAKLAGDPDVRVRFQCALSLGESHGDSAVVGPLVQIALTDGQDRWARAAVLSSIGGRELDFLRQFAAAPSPSAGSTELLAELGQQIAPVGPRPSGPRRCIRWWRRCARGRFKTRRPASPVCRKPSGGGEAQRRVRHCRRSSASKAVPMPPRTASFSMRCLPSRLKRPSITSNRSSCAAPP